MTTGIVRGGGADGLDAAMACVRRGDVAGARAALGVAERVSDPQLVEGLIALDKGLGLFLSQQTAAAAAPLRHAAQVLDASSDADARIVVLTLAQFAEGSAALLAGDAHSAAKLLAVGTETADKVAFYLPDFRRMAASARAASFIAVAKTFTNASDLPAAQRAFAEARQAHDKLLALLDPNDAADVNGFAEVYGTRVELVLLWITAVDLGTLDLATMKRRLVECADDVAKLREVVPKLADGPIRSLLTAFVSLIEALGGLHQAMDVALLRRRPFTQAEAAALLAVEDKLFQARRASEAAADRGRGTLYQVAQLERLQRNVLLLGRTATKDFGRFSGPLSLIALVVLMVATHLTFSPSGYESVLLFFGCLVASLVVGFGYGALRFRPLLKLFSEAMKKSEGDDDA